MKQTTFMISKRQPDGTVVIYHTLRTSLATMTEEAFNMVFMNHDFSDEDLVGWLRKLGFLIDDDLDEVGIIERFREEDTSKDSQVVTIFSTNDCNARCYYCFEEGLERESMSVSTANQIVSFIVKKCPKKDLQIQWFGGEPLMAMDIVECITLGLESHGFVLTTRVTTNGSLLTQEMLDFFKSHYRRIAFQITVDDIGDRYAKVKRYIDIPQEEAFLRVIENCKMVLRNGVYLDVRVNFHPQRIEAAKKVYFDLKALFKDVDNALMRTYLAPLTLSEDCGDCSATTLPPETFVELKKLYLEHELSKGKALDNVALLNCLFLKPRPVVCGQARKGHFVITAQGKIYKCHRLVRYKDGMYSIGDVWNGIDETSQHYREFCDLRVKDPDCRKCGMLPICQGACFAIQKLYGKKLACKRLETMGDLLDEYCKRRMTPTESEKRS